MTLYGISETISRTMLVCMLMASFCVAASRTPETPENKYYPSKQNFHSENDDLIWSQSEEYRTRMLLKGISFPVFNKEYVVKNIISKNSGEENVWQTLSEIDGIHSKAIVSLNKRFDREMSGYSYIDDEDGDLSAGPASKNDEGREEYDNQVILHVLLNSM